MPTLTLYGAPGSGAVAVEAALTLIGEPYDLIDAITWDTDEPDSGDKVLAANPLRQVPALVLASGEVLTESAAILIWLAEQYPVPALDELCLGGDLFALLGEGRARAARARPGGWPGPGRPHGRPHR
jgi:glutathione S-transferase